MLRLNNLETNDRMMALKMISPKGQNLDDNKTVHE